MKYHLRSVLIISVLSFSNHLFSQKMNAFKSITLQNNSPSSSQSNWLNLFNQADTAYSYGKNSSSENFELYGKAYNLSYNNGYIGYTFMEIDALGNFNLYNKRSFETSPVNGYVSAVYDSLRIGNTWIAYQKHTILYNSMNSVSEEHFYEYDLVDGWKEYRKIENTYLSNGRCGQSIEYQFIQNSGMQPTIKITNAYDILNRLTLSDLKAYSSFDGSYYDVSLNQYIYNYTTQPIIDSASQRIFYTYNEYLGLNTPQYKWQYLRNSFGKKESSIVEKWAVPSFPYEYEAEGLESFQYNNNGVEILETRKKLMNGIYYEFFRSQQYEYSNNIQSVTSRVIHDYDSSNFVGNQFNYIYGDSIAFVTNTISLNDYNNQVSFQIAENPGNGYIKLNEKHLFTIAEIYSIDGKLIDVINLSSEVNSIDIKILNQGLYLIRLVDSVKNSTVVKYLKNQ